MTNGLTTLLAALAAFVIIAAFSAWIAKKLSRSSFSKEAHEAALRQEDLKRELHDRQLLLEKRERDDQERY